MTWFFLLKNRLEICDVFQKFYNEAQKQFSTSIKVLRIDNAMEYARSTLLMSFWSSKGIIHQSSCAYTSQQNGVAERKNRHLLKVARTIMSHMSVPKQYWGDAILMACHLINRVLSLVLSHNSPFSCLYSFVKPFPLPPKIFGCLFCARLGTGPWQIVSSLYMLYLSWLFI